METQESDAEKKGLKKLKIQFLTPKVSSRLKKATTSAIRGLTLTEMLVVIGVIAILTGLLVPALMGARRSARIAVAKQDCQQIDIGMGLYNNDFGVFPPDYIPASPNLSVLPWPWGPPVPPDHAMPNPSAWAFGGVPRLDANNGLVSGECLVFFLFKRYSNELSQFDISPKDNIPDDILPSPDGIPDYFFLATTRASTNARQFLATANGGEYITIPAARLYDHDNDGFPVWMTPFGVNEVMNSPDNPASWYSFDNNQADNGRDPGEPADPYTRRLTAGPYAGRIRIKDYWNDRASFHQGNNTNNPFALSPYNRNVTNVHPQGVDIWSPPYEKVEIKTWRADDPNRPKDYCYVEFWDPTYSGSMGDSTYSGGSGGWFINSFAVDPATNFFRPLTSETLHGDINANMGTNFFDSRGKRQ